MLKFFRNAAKTWVFKGLFVLLILSFAIWGVGDSSFGGAGNRVATVGDADVSVEEYSRALQREMQSTSQRIGRRITVDEAQQAGLPQILLARLVRDAALNAETARLGISADDAAVRRAIMESPSFQGLGGGFDNAQYEFALDRLGFRPDAFEADMRRSIARDLLTFAVAGGAAPAPGLAERTLAHQLEERGFDLIRLSPEMAEAPAAPDDGALRTYIDENRSDFMRPETRAITWLAIDPVALISGVEVDEQELRDAYASHSETYDMPERRSYDQLSFADTAAANAAKGRIDRGEASFAELVAERGLSVGDVDRGAAVRTGLPEGIADAVFGLGAPGVAGPVGTDFGPALINLRMIAPARVVPFDEAKAELTIEIARDIAGEKAIRLAEQATDLLAAGAGVDGVAADLGLVVHTALALTAAGDLGAGPFAADPAFLAEAFAAEPAEIRDLIETMAGGWAMVRVDAVEETAPLGFEDARARATMDWTRDQRIDALATRAATAVADLRAGAAIAEVAKRFGAAPSPLGPIRRDGGAGLIAPDLLTALFAAPMGGAGMVRSDQGVYLGVVTAITPADLTAPQAAEALSRWREQLRGSMAEDMYAYYAAALQDRAGATVNQGAVDLVVNSMR
jgi:peptidyl-prolyl cis-trans isomerase D